MKIVFAASEIAPFVKTGGLADVAGSLPKYINRAEFDTILILPLYKNINRESYSLTQIGIVKVPHRDSILDAGLFRSVLPGSFVPVIFLDYSPFFYRDGIYNENGTDYEDNDERFAFFCRGALEACRTINFQPDIIHCNDWQTGLVPVYLRTLYSKDIFFSKTSVLFTIHNLAYRGLFNPEHAIWSSGLPWDVYNMYGVEFFGQFSFLKGGIYYSSYINTVSPGYSREIQTGEYGEGLHGLLHNRAGSLSGIINGLDYEVWNPATDPLIDHNFSINSIELKKENTARLCHITGLEYNEKSPVLGMITRLAEHKGIDITYAIIDDLVQRDIRMIILGTGDPHYHKLFAGIAENYPDKISVSLTFNDRLSHMIYAGSDIFLMPSRSEPCGLSQLISLKYGTIPVVRGTGGLADTITGYTDASEEIKANGFLFREYSGSAFLECIDKALEVFKDRAEWKKLMSNAMTCDFSWRESARKYEKLYRKLYDIKNKTGY